MSTEIASTVRQQFFDENGDPLSGARLYTYVAGTTTPRATFQDVDGLVPNTNPIILDAGGVARFRLGTGSYKFVMADPDDNVLWTEDNVQTVAGLISAITGALIPENNLSDLTDTSEAITNLEAGATGGNIVQVDRAQTLTQKTFDDEITLQELGATPTNPAIGYKKIYPKNDGKLYELDSDGNEIEVGSTAGGLPAVTEEKAFLELDGSLETQWQSAVFQGFSSRFGNAFFDITGIREAINAIFNFAYVLPGANLTSNVATSLREKGDEITAMTLSSSVTRNSDPIQDVTFYAGAIDPGNIIGSTQTGDPDSGVRTQAWTGSFSDNFTFRVRVRDDGTSNGGTPQNRDVALSYSFVYPYYFGADVPGLTPAQVAGLTKQIINSTANANRVYNFDVGDVFYFAYPASYGALASILDENGFENLSNFTLRTENITGLDASAVSYRIYEFNNVAGVSGTTNYTFIR